MYQRKILNVAVGTLLIPNCDKLNLQYQIRTLVNIIRRNIIRQVCGPKSCIPKVRQSRDRVEVTSFIY